jgi:hypothetical protein
MRGTLIFVDVQGYNDAASIENISDQVQSAVIPSVCFYFGYIFTGNAEHVS